MIVPSLDFSKFKLRRLRDKDNDHFFPVLDQGPGKGHLQFNPLALVEAL